MRRGLAALLLALGAAGAVAAAGAPETAVPESAAPERAAPERVVPQHAVSERVVPEHDAPESAAPGHVTPGPATAGQGMPEGAALPRVVSMNLCTDQLALLLAAPGQVLSVSALARDPMLSATVEAARAVEVNHGRAEEVFLARPDLVLAGTYTSRASVEMLRRLGLRVETLPPVDTLEQVRGHILQLGRAMGREARAEALVAEFDAGLAALRAEAGQRPSVAIYHPNGYTTGGGTLADAILTAAGLSNLASELGISGGATLPLERLILARPQALVRGQAYPGASRSEEILSHPALRELARSAASAQMRDADWICGTPRVLAAIAQMARLRQRIEGRTLAGAGTGAVSAGRLP